jgi:hypothetical protein
MPNSLELAQNGFVSRKGKDCSETKNSSRSSNRTLNLSVVLGNKSCGNFIDKVFRFLHSYERNKYTSIIDKLSADIPCDSLATSERKQKNIFTISDKTPETLNSNFHEIWKEIPGFSGRFVSTLGRIKRKDGNVCELKPDQGGYITTAMRHDDGYEKRLRTHRIVAEMFIPNPYNKEYVHHINGIRDDNRVSNLQWATVSENNNKRVNISESRTTRRVGLYDSDKLLKAYNSILEAAADTKSSPFYVVKLLKGKKTNLFRGKYYWKYLDEEVLPDEEWRFIIVRNVKIGISSFGRVKLKSGKITCGVEKNGYMHVKIANKPFSVHRLVCIAFKWKEGCQDLEVNHLDEDKKNNKVENLEFVTGKENMRHSFGKAVCQYTLTGEFIQRFECIKGAGETTGVCSSSIGKVCSGEQKTAGGFLWKYAADDEME